MNSSLPWRTTHKCLQCACEDSWTPLEEQLVWPVFTHPYCRHEIRWWLSILNKLNRDQKILYFSASGSRPVKWALRSTVGQAWPSQWDGLSPPSSRGWRATYHRRSPWEVNGHSDSRNTRPSQASSAGDRLVTNKQIMLHGSWDKCPRHLV